jgi:NTE family protein
MCEQAGGRVSPRIGVALGGGAARGLTHIPYIEAMDELGVRPATIAGTSIGALIGAGWANGMTGKELRDHACGVLGSLQLIAGKLWSAGRTSLKGALQTGISIQADPRAITDAFLPDHFPDDFAALDVPLNVVATDLGSWEQVVFGTGPLRQAIAASIAIPSLFRPVAFGGRLFVDGGVTNPLPLDRAAIGADILVGIDVNGGPDEKLAASEPNMLDAGFIASQIISQTLIRYMVRLHPPDVYVRPSVNEFGILEFWRVREILACVETDKDRFKRELTKAIEAFEQRRRGGRVETL